MCTIEQYRPIDDPKRMPPIVSMAAEVSSTEECLRKWFKCTYESTQPHKTRCFATRLTDNGFREHLETTHPTPIQIFCCYCHRFCDENKTTLPHESLVEHIKSEHRFRRYQCNLCLFRAITAEHVNIHQAVIHSKIHSATINNNAITDKRCKILECPPVDEQYVPSHNEFYYHSKAYRRCNNVEPCEHYYQCFYCTFMNECKLRVVDHCAQKHPDYVIMYYCPDPDITSTQKSPIDKDKHISNNHSISADISSQEPQENCISSTGVHDSIDLESDSNSDKATVTSSIKRDKKKSTDDFPAKKKVKLNDNTRRVSVNADQEKRYKCELCSITDIKESVVGLHLGSVHKTTSRYCCGVCRKYFGTNEQIVAHCTANHNNFVSTDVSYEFIKTYEPPLVIDLDDDDDGSDAYRSIVKDGVKNDVKRSVKSENEVSDDLEKKIDIKRVKKEIKKEIKTEIKTEIKDEIKKEEISDISNANIANINTVNVTTNNNQQILSDVMTPITEKQLPYICLFCDFVAELQVDAVNHIETHFPTQVVDASDGGNELSTRFNSWIRQFLLKQSVMTSYEDTGNNAEENSAYQCPICVKVAKLNGRKARKYSTMIDVQTHIWQHSCWFPVSCLLCQKQELPNCYRLIFNHMRDKHMQHLQLIAKKNELSPESIVTSLSSVQLTALESSLEIVKSFKFISSDNIIDKYLDNVFKTFVNENENRLRDINDVPEKCWVVVERLPDIDFTDDQIVYQYLVENGYRNERASSFSSIETISSDDEDKHAKNCESVARKILGGDAGQIEFIDLVESSQKNVESTAGTNIPVVTDSPNNEDVVKNTDPRIRPELESSEKKPIVKQEIKTETAVKSEFQSPVKTEAVASTSSTITPKIEAILDEKKKQVQDSLTPELPVGCWYCGERFVGLKFLKIHHKSTHPGTLVKSISRPRV